MEVKHTPGPWKVSKANPHRVIVAEGDKAGLDIADIRVFVAAYRETSLANARLIVAAPDLVQAAKCALGYLTGNMDGDMDLGDPTEMLRDAIAKAECRS